MKFLCQPYTIGLHLTVLLTRKRPCRRTREQVPPLNDTAALRHPLARFIDDLRKAVITLVGGLYPEVGGWGYGGVWVGGNSPVRRADRRQLI